MPTLLSLWQVTAVAFCAFGLTCAKPAMFKQQDAILDFDTELWNDKEHIFQGATDKIHSATDKVTAILQNGFAAFSHPAFPDYALRYNAFSLRPWCETGKKRLTLKLCTI